MKRIVLLLLSSFFLVSVVEAQEKVPKSALKTIHSLATHLTQGKSSDQEKAKAIYEWVTQNIAYDYTKLDKDKAFTTIGPKKLIKSKKALSSDYCMLTVALLSEAGIDAESVSGYIQQGNALDSMFLNVDTHVWVAAKLDGQWKFMDPTWDAGYIGYPPPKPKKKKKKKTNKDGEEVQEETAKPVSQKVQFVSEPKLKYFCTATDTFLKTHLPAHPMWQLRSDTIGLSTFRKGNKIMESVLAATPRGGDYPFQKALNTYENVNFAERRILTADNGFRFNPGNARIKTMEYYYFISIYMDKEVRKQIKELPEHEGSALYQKLLHHVDTVNTYLKRCKEVETVTYKTRNSILKSNGKALSQAIKDTKKAAADGNKLNTSTINDVLKSDERIGKDVVWMEGEADKLVAADKDMRAIDRKELDINLEHYGTWKDSLASVEANLIRIEKEYRDAIANSVLPNCLDNLMWNERLLYLNHGWTEMASLDMDSLIQRVYFLLDSNYTVITLTYEDSIQKEIFQADFTKNLKQLFSYAKAADAALREAEKAGEVDNLYPHVVYLNNLKFDYTVKGLHLSDEAYNHNFFLRRNLEKWATIWNGQEMLAESIEVSEKERLQKVLEDEQHRHNREVDLYAQLKTKTSKYKTEIRTKMKSN